MNSFVEGLQRDTVQVLQDQLAGAGTVALLDHPNHFNAGDLLIYQGELRYLHMVGAEVGYVCARYGYDRGVLTGRAPEGPLLLHGGGNFGDRYPKYQSFREHVISEHRDRRIIQLPQTIEFRDREALRRAQQVYQRHPDLTLLMRDRPGVELARELFPDNNIVFCPDMAFGAGMMEPSAEPTSDVVLLKRIDQESAHSANALPEYFRDSHQADWHLGFSDNLRWWPITVASSYGHRIPMLRARIYPFTRRGFDKQTDMIVDSAISILSHGRVVVTDRLHAAIYGVLLGKPVVMVDNANKKLSTIYRDYLGTAPNTYLAGDFGEAAAIAQTLV